MLVSGDEVMTSLPAYAVILPTSALSPCRRVMRLSWKHFVLRSVPSTIQEKAQILPAGPAAHLLTSP